MDLNEHYEDLFQSSLQRLQSDQYEVDGEINNPNDSRRGITLLARPDDNTKTKVEAFLELLRQIDPGQYYYPPTDLHITILSIISCQSTFTLSQINVTDYCEIIEDALKDIAPFSIEFRGITASPAGILLKGYPEGKAIETIRNLLRERFKNTTLFQSLDKRYIIQSVHSTIMRYCQPVSQKPKLVEFIKGHKETILGKFQVDQLELVCNDWYQRADQVELIKKFGLIPNS